MPKRNGPVRRGGGRGRRGRRVPRRLLREPRRLRAAAGCRGGRRDVDARRTPVLARSAGPAGSGGCRGCSSSTAARTRPRTDSGHGKTEPSRCRRRATRAARTSGGDEQPRCGRVAGRDHGVLGALLGDEQPHHAVEQETGAAEEGEHDEEDPQDRRVDVEVAAEPAGDPGDLAVGVGAPQLAVVLEVARCSSPGGGPCGGAPCVEGVALESRGRPRRCALSWLERPPGGRRAPSGRTLILRPDPDGGPPRGWARVVPHGPARGAV